MENQNYSNFEESFWTKNSKKILHSDSCDELPKCVWGKKNPLQLWLLQNLHLLPNICFKQGNYKMGKNHTFLPEALTCKAAKKY